MGPSDDPDGVTLWPYPQPSQAVIDQDQKEQTTVSQVQDQQRAVCLDQEQHSFIDQNQDQHALKNQDQNQHTAAICQNQEQVSVRSKAQSDTVVISSDEINADIPEESLPDEKGAQGEDLCPLIQMKSKFGRLMCINWL